MNTSTRMPTNVLSYSLSEAICAIGIPNLEIGLAAANAGLVVISAAGQEGTLNFEWDKKKLDRHSVKFLQEMLLSLRQAVGATP